MRRLALVVAFGILGGGTRAGDEGVRELLPSDGDLKVLSWMVGSWVMEAGGKTIDEHWSHPAAGTMMGTSRTIARDKTVFFEFIRIEKREDGIYYLASPKGRMPPTAFKLIETGDRRAVFENPGHDFPQRVTYWREDGGRLIARISGKENGEEKSSDFTYQKARLVTE